MKTLCQTRPRALPMASRPRPRGGGGEKEGTGGRAGGSRVSLKSFHVVPEIFGDSRRLRSESSPKCEVSGWVVGPWGGASGLEPKP